MYNTWAYRCTKYERNRILSCDRDIDGPYRHSLLIANCINQLEISRKTLHAIKFVSKLELI